MAYRTHHVRCRLCKRTIALHLDDDCVAQWQSGERIQDVFPQLSADDREMMISQTCNWCWEEIMITPEKGEVA